MPPPTQERTPSFETKQPLTSSGYDVCASPPPLCHPHASSGYPFSCVPCIVRQWGIPSIKTLMHPGAYVDPRLTAWVATKVVAAIVAVLNIWFLFVIIFRGCCRSIDCTIMNEIWSFKVWSVHLNYTFFAGSKLERYSVYPRIQFVFDEKIQSCCSDVAWADQASFRMSSQGAMCTL